MQKHAEPYGSLYRLQSLKQEKEVAKREEKVTRSLTDSCIGCDLSKWKRICKEEKMRSDDISQSPLHLFQVSCPKLSMVLEPRGRCFVFPKRPLFSADRLIQRQVLCSLTLPSTDFFFCKWNFSLIKRTHYNLRSTVLIPSGPVCSRTVVRGRYRPIWGSSHTWVCSCFTCDVECNLPRPRNHCFYRREDHTTHLRPKIWFPVFSHSCPA